MLKEDSELIFFIKNGLIIDEVQIIWLHLLKIVECAQEKL